MKSSLPTNIIKKNQGFTLIELLVVIGILAILLAITLIAINPARQFGQANNTNRRSAITQYLNAIGAFAAENRGQLPAEIDALADDTPTDITGANFPNLCAELIPDYIPALPVDPTVNNGTPVEAGDCAGGAWDSGYTVEKDANNRVTIAAPAAENGETITVSR